MSCWDQVPDWFLYFWWAVVYDIFQMQTYMLLLHLLQAMQTPFRYYLQDMLALVSALSTRIFKVIPLIKLPLVGCCFFSDGQNTSCVLIACNLSINVV